MTTWNEFQPQFTAAIERLDKLVGHAVNVCNTFEKLITEVSKFQGNEGQTFIDETQIHLNTLNHLSEVTDKESIPPEAYLLATEIYMRMNYVTSVISRLESTFGEKAESLPEIKIPKGASIH